MADRGTVNGVSLQSRTAMTSLSPIAVPQPFEGAATDASLRRRAARVIPGGLWGHMSAARLPEGYPQFFARARGCRLHTAVRALAYKWQRILWRCWQDRKPYCEQTYLAALTRPRSPLAIILNSKSPSNDPPIT